MRSAPPTAPPSEIARVPAAPLPDDEEARLAELSAYGALDLPSDEALAELVRLAASMYEVPTAAISFVDADRQVFMARVGLDVAETPRDASFCAHALLSPGRVLVVEDTLADPRFVDNALVIGAPNIRFYAGAPLVTPSGRALGTLCLIDQRPRGLGRGRMRSLKTLADLVVSRLDQRRLQAERSHLVRRADEAIDRFFRLSQDMLCVADLQGNFLKINPSFSRVLGYSDEELLGRPYLDLIHPDDLAQTLAVLGGLREGRPVSEFENRYRCKDGDYRILQWSAKPDIEAGQLYATARDLTEHHARALELDRFFMLSQDMLCIADLKGNFLKINPAFTRVLGYSEEELLGHPFLDLVHPGDLAATLHEMETLSAGVTTFDFENRYRCRDGSYRTFLWASKCDAECGLIYASARDVTEYRARAAELFTFRETLDQTFDCILIKQADSLRITYANRGACNQLGYTAEELRGMEALAINADLDAAAYRAMIAPLLAGSQQVVAYEARQRRKDGTTYPVEVRLQYIPRSSGPGLLVSVARDISRRRDLEGRLREQLRTAALSADVGLSLSAGTSLAAMLQGCAEAIVRHFDVAFARFWTLDDESQMLALRASAGLYTNIHGRHARIPVGQLKIGRVASSRRPHLTNDVANDPNIGDPDWARREGMVAFAGYPLMIGERLLGVLGMFARAPLGETVLEALEAITGQIALGIERKRAEEALRRSEEIGRRLSMAVNGTDNGIVVINRGLQIEWVNSGFEHMTGYRLDEVRGLLPGAFLHGPDTDPATIRYMAGQLADEEGFTVEVLNYRKSGEPYWSALSVQPIADAAGAATGFIGIQRDITERKRAEAALLESQARERYLTLAISRTDDAVDLVDGNLRIQWVNDGFERLTGYRLADVFGRCPSDFLQGPETDPKTVAYMGECLAAGVGFAVEIINYHRSGRPYWTALKMHPVREGDGSVSGYITIQRDVSERKEAERALRAARDAADQARREAEVANEAKSRFLANMSHELRTPLNSILGYSEMLQVLARRDGQEEYLADLTRIRASGEHLLALINDILDISKIEAGRVDLLLEEFDVAGLLDDIMATSLPLAECNHNALELVVDAPPGRMFSDLVRVRQVLLNFVGNACKFTTEGRVEVRLARATNDDLMVFEVADTGIGIAPEDIQRVFDPFVQADNSTTRRHGGTGLGLAICRKLSEMLGGRIEVRSAKGVGSTFTFSMPRRHRGEN